MSVTKQDIKDLLVEQDKRIETKLKTLKSDIQKEIRQANEEQSQKLADVVASVVENLDGVFADKELEDNVEKMREHFHATP